MKKALLLVVMFLMNSYLMADSIVGFWKTIDEKTKKQQSIIAIYEYKSRYFGRIVATFNEQGNAIAETLSCPKERAPGVKGRPYYCGMDIIWNLQSKGNKYTNGKILDPEHGHVYDVDMWTKNGSLVVRGKMLCFGRNQTWLPVTEKDMALGFQMPNLTQFVPLIPKVK